jgi:hypothetical protein
MPVSETCEPFLECTDSTALMTVAADGTAVCNLECKHGDYDASCPAHDEAKIAAELTAFTAQIDAINNVDGATLNVGTCLKPNEYALWDEELQNFKCHTQIMDYINACDLTETFTVTNYFDGATDTTVVCSHCLAGGLRLVDEYFRRGPACVTNIDKFTTSNVTAFRNNAMCDDEFDTTWYGCVARDTTITCDVSG